jgi:hypothetical protein
MIAAISLMSACGNTPIVATTSTTSTPAASTGTATTTSTQPTGIFSGSTGTTAGTTTASTTTPSGGTACTDSNGLGGIYNAAGTCVSGTAEATAALQVAATLYGGIQAAYASAIQATPDPVNSTLTQAQYIALLVQQQTIILQAFSVNIQAAVQQLSAQAASAQQAQNANSILTTIAASLAAH